MSDRKATYRLQARVPLDLYNLVREAAAAEGLTLADYLLVTLRKAAEVSLENHRIRLSSENQAAFAKALMEPPPFSGALKRAMARRREMLGR